MAEVVTGVALKALFSEAIKAVKKAIKTIRLLKPRLKTICSYLIVLEPIVTRIKSINEQLDIPKDELEQILELLKNCKELAEKCEKIKKFDIVALYRHSKLLFDLERRLKDFCVIMALINNKDVKELTLMFQLAFEDFKLLSGVVLQPEEKRLDSTHQKITTAGFPVNTDTMVDLVSGTLVGALVAELLSVKNAIETTHLEIIGSTLESLKTQIEEMNTFNEELRPIHNLLKAGLGLIKKCRKLRKSQFWDKPSYCEKLLDDDLDNGILRFCQVDLVGIVVGDVKIDRVDVSGLIVEIETLSELLEKDRTIQFKSCDVPLAPDYLVGFDAPYEDIKKKLLNGKEPVIVISAAEGYGKTALVTKLCHDQQITGKYKDIIFVVASESTNLMTVIYQIINHLGGKVRDPETHTEDNAFQLLQQLLARRAEKNPILVVLDDWSESKSILEKFMIKDIPNYIVLVTSRSELPGVRYSHQLEGLDHEDAVKLLRHAAIPSVCDYSDLPNDITINKVAKLCQGYPLALKVLGESLYGKPEAAWQAKLEEWSNGTSLPNDMRSLMNSLRGLDGTNGLDRVKHCFLDLGSFPEDHRICVATLIDMWSVLYNMDGYMDAVAALMELYARRLVNLANRREEISVGNGYYNDVHVMQTNILVRELTIHLNREGPIEERERLNLDIRNNKLPEWTLPKEQKQSLKARLVSIYTDEHFKAEWPDLELLAAEVLVLSFRATENYTLPEFVENMVNLKALIVINNGPLPVEVNNFHVIASIPNLKKIRLENVKIAPLTLLDFSLDNLEKISAFFCDISGGIPTSYVQFHDVYPNLKEIDISYSPNLKTLPNGICEAETLKTISITNCHQLSELPEEIGNLLELQVLRVSRCANLVKLPDSIGDLDSLNFLDISNCVSIEKLPENFGRLHQLKELNLSGCSKLSSLPSSVRRLKQLENLIVGKPQKFKRFFRNHSKLEIKWAEEERSEFFGWISEEKI